MWKYEVEFGGVKILMRGKVRRGLVDDILGNIEFVDMDCLDV